LEPICQIYQTSQIFSEVNSGRKAWPNNIMTASSNEKQVTVSAKLGEADSTSNSLSRMTKHSRLRCFKTSPKIIRLAVMFYVRSPLASQCSGSSTRTPHRRKP
jgi:hypothetical protein